MRTACGKAFSLLMTLACARDQPPTAALTPAPTPGRSFVEVQTIATSGASSWKSFEISGKRYLAFAKYYDGSSYNINSKV